MAGSDRPRRSDPVDYVEVVEEEESERSESGSEGDTAPSRSSKEDLGKGGPRARSSKSVRVAKIELKQESSDDEYGRKRSKSKPKRQKTAREKNRKWEIGLLLNLPLDIFVICAYLSPLDLFNLSWMCKDLQRILSSPAHAGTWKASRVQHGLPTLSDPPKMSEYQYASFLFSGVCSECGSLGSKEAGTVLLELKVLQKWCELCRKKLLTRLTPLAERESHPDTLRMIPTFRYTPDLAEPGHFQFTFAGGVKTQSDLLYRLRQNDIVSEKNKLRLAFKNASASGAFTSVSQVSDLLARKTDQLKDIEEAATNVRVALNRMALRAELEAKASVRKYTVANQRRVDLEYKLSSMEGWTKEDFEDPSWGAALQVRRNKPLHEEDWQKLLPSLVKLRNKNRQQALAAARIAARGARKADIHPFFEIIREEVLLESSAKVFPHFDLFLHFDSVLPFWQSDDSKFVQLDWDNALPLIKTEARGCYARTRALAIRTILTATTNEEISDDLTIYNESTYPDSFFLPLTSYLFCPFAYCRSPSEYLASWMRAPFYGAFPDLLEHLSSKHDGVNESHDETQGVCFDLPRAVSRALFGMLESVGLDPKSALLKDLLLEKFQKFRWTNDPIFVRDYPWLDLLHRINGMDKYGAKGDPIIENWTSGTGVVQPPPLPLADEDRKDFQLLSDSD